MTEPKGFLARNLKTIDDHMGACAAITLFVGVVGIYGNQAITTIQNAKTEQARIAVSPELERIKASQKVYTGNVNGNEIADTFMIGPNGEKAFLTIDGMKAEAYINRPTTTVVYDWTKKTISDWYKDLFHR